MSENNNNTQVVELPLTSITPSFGNDRTVFDEAAIADLAASIEANGLVQPITVRPLGDNRYQLIAGERRYRAHVHLGREFIRAIIATMDDAQAAAAMLVENTGRKDLDPIDEARAYARRREMGWDDAQIAACAGVNIQIVRNRIKLLSLNSDIQHLVRTGNLQIGYANVLADAELDKNRQRIVLGRLINNPAPTVTWFRRECAELAAQQAQNAMFDDSFDFSATTGQNVNAESVKLPADPKTDSAPMVGKTYRDMMQNRINFWTEAADKWDRYGKTANRDRCLAAAKECESLLAFMPADHNFRGKRVKRGNKVLIVYVATAEPVAPVIEIPEPAPVVIEAAPVIEPAIEDAPVIVSTASGDSVTLAGEEFAALKAVQNYDDCPVSDAVVTRLFDYGLITGKRGYWPNQNSTYAFQLSEFGIAAMTGEPVRVVGYEQNPHCPAVIEPAIESAAQSIEDILADTPIPAARPNDADTLSLDPFGALPAGLDYFCDKELNRYFAEIQYAEDQIRAAIKANRYRIDNPQLALLNARAADARRNLMIHLVKHSRVA